LTVESRLICVQRSDRFSAGRISGSGGSCGFGEEAGEGFKVKKIEMLRLIAKTNPEYVPVNEDVNPEYIEANMGSMLC
jgi:hypothetical protein